MNASYKHSDLEPMLRSLRAIGIFCWGFGGLCIIATIMAASPVTAVQDRKSSDAPAQLVTVSSKLATATNLSHHELTNSQLSNSKASPPDSR